MLILALIAGCKETKTSPDESPTPEPDKPKVRDQPVDAAPAGSIAREVTLDQSGKKVRVKLRVPAAWTARSDGFAEPEPYEGVWPSMATVSFGGYSCSGPCKDEDFQRELAALIEGEHDRLATPNKNTGDPARDAVRLEVTELAAGDIDHGKFVAHRVRKPDGLQGPYFEGSSATCAFFRPGDDYYIAVRVTATRAREAELFDELLGACKEARAEKL